MLVEGSDKLVKMAGDWFSSRIRKKLEDSPHVYLLFGKRVTEVMENGVAIDGEFTPSKTVIWSGGVRARTIGAMGDGILDIDERSNRIKVNPYLQVEKHNEIYVVGDQAWVYDKEHEQPYPMRAQFAARQGTIAGRNIANEILNRAPEEFAWKEQGFIVSLGTGGAFAEVFGHRVSGWPAWFLYRTAYLMKTFGWRSKFRMALEWTLNTFLPRDISKL